jgi:tungstate transport system substrate-binding protein
MRCWIVFASLVAVACAETGERRVLDLATTTSVKNSGLLDALLPAFKTSSGITVRVHAAGSGRALEMLADGVVELAVTHAPEAEAEYLTAHPLWSYQKIAYNWFVVVGPPSDPANVGDATGAGDAFRRIALGSAPFVSRGDGSGTHERELALWRAAGTTPPAVRLLVSGRGMALALRHADERRAYTLSDEATFRQLQSGIDLAVLYQGDLQLLNTYAVVHANDGQLPQRFATWLTRGEGAERIRSYRIGGRPGFHVWPDRCSGLTPDARPCESASAPAEPR